MSCDECERCKAMGYKFCVKCGQNFAEEAIVPQHHVDKGGVLSDDVLARTVYPAVIVVAVALVATVGIIIFNCGGVFDTVFTMRTTVYLFLPLYVPLTTITGQELQYFWMFIATVILACAILVFYDSRSLFRFNTGHYIEDSKKTPLYGIAMVLGAVLVIEFLIAFLMMSLGYKITTPPDMLKWTLEESIFQYAKAGVWEEIAFRLVPFGVPMMIAAIGFRRKDFLKYLFGGFGASKLSVILWIITSLIFAFAHVEGWGSWKFLVVLPGGFMLGYLFMRYGIHAAIIAHTLNDFLTVWVNALGFYGSLLEMGILITGFVCIPMLLNQIYVGARNLKRLPGTGMNQDRDDSNGPSAD